MATGLPSGESALNTQSYVSGARIVYGSNGSVLVDLSGSAGGQFIVEVAYGATYGQGTNVLTVLGINNQSSGSSSTNALIQFTPTVNQSGTAGYTGILLNVTETATGSGTKNLLDMQVGGTSKFTVNDAGSITTINGQASGGSTLGVPVIVAYGRSTAQTAAVASVAAFTVGAADATFIVSANVLITASTTFSFTVTVAYTDEGNTARTLTLSFTLVAGGSGGLTSTIANGGGAVPYMGIPQQIRCKTGTTITVATTGTFTTVTYNVEAAIQRIA